MSSELPPDEEIARLFNEALASDVKKLMSGQVRALAASDTGLLFLLADIVSLLIKAGAINKDELLGLIDFRVNTNFTQEPIDHVNLISTVYKNFAESVRRLENDNGKEEK